MGDRANVLVIDDDSNVYLYTHWCGSELPEMVKASIKRHARWDDGSYLARIIFQDMVNNDLSCSGFGISSVCGDGDDRIIEVDVDNQEVRIGEMLWNFTEFCNLEHASWGRKEEEEEEE